MEQKCFKLFGEKENEQLCFEEALAKCRSMGDGHDLVSVHNKQEQGFLDGVMYGSSYHAWIGLQNQIHPSFLWTDNSDVTFTNWAPGEPTQWFNSTDENGTANAVRENCVEIWRDPPKHNRTGQWNDQNCDSKRAYICERSGERITTCQKPETPKYARISLERDNIDSLHLWNTRNGYLEVGTILKYRCVNDYYQINGNPWRECLNTGEWSGSQPRCVPVCGLPKDPKNPFIVLGNVSDIGDWPWQVAIRDLTKTDHYLLCGGTLIDGEWILTAAHCVTEENEKTVRRVDELELYFGKYYYSLDKDDQHVVKAEIQQIVVHNQFSPHTLDFDIALIRSRRIIEFNDRIRPACLPDPSIGYRTEIAYRNEGIVTGWGNTERAVPSNELKYAVLEVIPNSECQRVLNTIPGNEPTDVYEVDKRNSRSSPEDEGSASGKDESGLLEKLTRWFAPDIIHEF